MNEHITNKLIEATYQFCVKRISDTESAKNLSQDILYEAIRNIADGKEFVIFPFKAYLHSPQNHNTFLFAGTACFTNCQRAGHSCRHGKKGDCSTPNKI